MYIFCLYGFWLCFGWTGGGDVGQTVHGYHLEEMFVFISAISNGMAR